MVKEDCFAYKGIKCDALHKLYCEEGKCNFYKTKKQLREEQEKLKNRE